MVQVDPNEQLSLEALSASGVVLPVEQKVALQFSLPLKKAETALEHMQLWGRITTQNGRDYLIALGFNKGFRFQGKVQMETRFFYSQDGAVWLDLQPIAADVAAKVRKFSGMLAGDPSKVYSMEEDGEVPPAPEVAEGEAAPAEVEPPKIVTEVSELQRLAELVASITADTNVAPVGAFKETSNNTFAVNRMFEGLQYPGKLESYYHMQKGPGSEPLSKDVRGSWALQYDGFSGVAQVRSLVWPGYAFFFNGRTGAYGGLYHGPGFKNHDLVFML